MSSVTRSPGLWAVGTPDGPVYHRHCWLAAHGRYEGRQMPSCDGMLRKVHLIPQQLIRREAPDAWVWDDSVWVWACGGPTGCGGHHGAFDVARTLRVARDEIPRATEIFAIRWGLGWWLERTYGKRGG